MNTLVAFALCFLLGISARVDAKEVLCRILTTRFSECQLRPLNSLTRCDAVDVQGGLQTKLQVADDQPFCVTTVTKRANNDVYLYRGNTTKTGATTCVELCKLYAAGGDTLLYFGCVKKTDGDWINFGMDDTNENSEYLTYLPLNRGPWKCPEEVESLPLGWYQSAAIGVVSAGIIAIVVGAIILYFGWIRSMPESGRASATPSAPREPAETTF